MDLYRPRNMIPFRFFVDVPVINPTIAVRGHFPTGSLFQRVTHSRIALQSLQNVDYTETIMR